jgi:hypothetical protein
MLYAAEAARRHACCPWPADPPIRLAILRAAGEELDVLPRPAGTARTSLPDEDALIAEPEVEALVGLARCARRLPDGTTRSPCAVRSTACGLTPAMQATTTCPCSV